MGRMRILFVGLCIVTCSLQAPAQEKPSGKPVRPERTQRDEKLTPNQLHKIWQLEVKGLVHSSGLNGDQGRRITELYVDARQRLHESVRTASEQDDSGSGMKRIVGEEREKLRAELSILLDNKQLKRAMNTLGAFNTSWDRMVNALMGFGLEKDAKYKALVHIEDYVAEASSLHAPDGRGRNQESIQRARSRLNDALSGLLDESQMRTMMRATTTRNGNESDARDDGRPPAFSERMKRFDTNGDGKLQKEELPDRMQRMFDRLDANGDGAIDPEELSQLNQGGSRGEGGSRNDGGGNDG